MNLELPNFKGIPLPQKPKPEPSNPFDDDDFEDFVSVSVIPAP